MNCEGKPEGKILTQCLQQTFYDLKIEREVLRAVVQEV